MQAKVRNIGEDTVNPIPNVIVHDPEDYQEFRGVAQLARRPDFPQWRSPFQAPGLYSGRAEYEENVLLRDNTNQSLRVSMFDSSSPLPPPPPPVLRPLHLPSISESILQGPWRLSFAASTRKPSVFPTISISGQVPRPEKSGSQAPTLSGPAQLSNEASAEASRLPHEQTFSNKATTKMSDLELSSKVPVAKSSGGVQSGRGAGSRTEHTHGENTIGSTDKLQILPTEHGPIVQKTSMHLGDMCISQRLASSSISLLRFTSYGRRRDKSPSTSDSSFDSSRSSHSLPRLTIDATNPKTPSEAKTMSRRQSSSVYTSQGNSGSFSDGSSIFENSLPHDIDRGKHQRTAPLDSIGNDFVNDDRARILADDGEQVLAYNTLSGMITPIDGGDDITETLSDVYKQEINLNSGP